MTTNAYDDVLPHLAERNKVVERIIKDTATKHAAMDATIDGAAGLSPIPGTAAVVLFGQLVAQTKILYPAMISKIALAYNADPDEYTSKVARKATLDEGIINALVFAAENGVLEDIGMQIKADLANEFGTEFLTTLMQEALGESAGGLALAQVPWVGVPAGAAVAGLLAWKLTWRVGLAVSLYYQNGGQFVGGSRKATTSLIKTTMVSGKRPVNLDGVVDGVRKTVPEVEQNMRRYVERDVRAARASELSDSQVEKLLLNKGFPLDVIKAALRTA